MMIKERRWPFDSSLLKQLISLTLRWPNTFPESDKKEIKEIILHAAVHNAETCNNYEIRDKYN